MKKFLIAATIITTLPFNQALADNKTKIITSDSAIKVKEEKPKKITDKTTEIKKKEVKKKEIKKKEEVKKIEEVIKPEPKKEEISTQEVKEVEKPKYKLVSKSENFAGISASIGVGAVGYSSQLQYHGSDAASDFATGKTGAVAVLNLSYLKAISDRWLFGIGTSYDLSSGRTGEMENFDKTSRTDYSANTKIKEHQSFYIQPTYALSRKSALFGKLGYHSALASISDTGQLFADLSSYSRRIQGIGYGFGAINFLDENVFVKTELEVVNYDRITMPYSTGHLTYRLQTTAAIVSLGYRF